MYNIMYKLIDEIHCHIILHNVILLSIFNMYITYLVEESRRI